jgi:3-hydroxyacyl-[acyl-carrier-protein] dehydratase
MFLSHLIGLSSMRWYLIDKFLVFESGRRAVAVKNVTAAEEAVDGYLPGFPILPPSLIVEGLAQTGGLLVGEVNQFEELVVLAKVSRARFHDIARAGETLTYTAEIQDVKAGGAVVKGTSHIGDRLQGEFELIFAHLDDRFGGKELFPPALLLRMLRALGLYDVGRDRDGAPLKVPKHMLAAEQAEDAADPPSERPVASRSDVEANRRVSERSRD